MRQKLIRQFVVDYSLELGLSPVTQKNKRNSMARFSNFIGDRPLTPEICRDYFAHLRQANYQPSSVVQEIKVIRSFVNFLHKRGHIDKSFAKDLVLPKIPKKLLEIVSAETAENIIIAGTDPSKFDNKGSSFAKEETRIGLRFALRTGLRISELTGLRAEDINLDSELFSVKSKGGNIDVMPLPRDMADELKPRIERGDRLFQVTKETLNSSIDRGRKKLGISQRLTCHSLRHTFCTTLLKNGIPLQIVSRLMRHSSIKITDEVYSHYQTEDLRTALITGHPLLRKLLSANDWLKLAEAVLKRSGIMDSGKFTLTTSPGRLVLNAGAV